MLNPITIIRQALSKCPDENPPASTTELNFISDTDLRTSLRIDIGAVNKALSNCEWKAATVLAGSAIEALLLWCITNRRSASSISHCYFGWEQNIWKGTFQKSRIVGSESIH